MLYSLRGTFFPPFAGPLDLSEFAGPTAESMPAQASSVTFPVQSHVLFGGDSDQSQFPVAGRPISDGPSWLDGGPDLRPVQLERKPSPFRSPFRFPIRLASPLQAPVSGSDPSQSSDVGRLNSDTFSSPDVRPDSRLEQLGPKLTPFRSPFRFPSQPVSPVQALKPDPQEQIQRPNLSAPPLVAPGDPVKTSGPSTPASELPTPSGAEPQKSPDEEFEIDLEVDPLQNETPMLVADWEAAVRLIKPREPVVEDSAVQRQKVIELLERIKNVDIRSDPSSQAEAEAILSSLPDILRNVDHFVVGSFTSCYAAWATLFKKSERRSAKTVLGWLKNGVKPQFVGTADAKEKKRTQVIGMLKRQVPTSEIPHMLSGDRPYPVVFENHKSFYDNWEFSSGEITKLVLWGGMTVVREGEEMPIVIHPMGVAFTGGKGRLIINSRYANLFMKLLQFRYERLRDILAFTKQGYFMANWDLKSGY
jgi:hypothetical protein